MGYRFKQVFHVSHTKLHAHSFPGIPPQSSGVDGGTVAGSVIGTLAALVLVAIAVVVPLVILYHNMNRRKQLERMQLDIFAL